MSEDLALFLDVLPDYDPASLPEKVPFGYVHRVLGMQHQSLLSNVVFRGDFTPAIHGVMDRHSHRYLQAWVDRDELIAYGLRTGRIDPEEGLPAMPEKVSRFLAGLPDFDVADLPERIPVRFLDRVLGLTTVATTNIIWRGDFTPTIHDALDRPKRRYGKAWVDRDEVLRWGRSTGRLNADNTPNLARLEEVLKGATTADYTPGSAGRKAA